MPFTVKTRNVDGQATALGSAGPFMLVVDRPPEAGGGLGPNASVRLAHVATTGAD